MTSHQMREADERRLCRFLSDKINVEVPRLLGDIVDAATVSFPRASAKAIAEALAHALTEGNADSIALSTRANSIAVQVEESPR